MDSLPAPRRRRLTPRLRQEKKWTFIKLSKTSSVVSAKRGHPVDAGIVDEGAELGTLPLCSQGLRDGVLKSIDLPNLAPRSGES